MLIRFELSFENEPQNVGLFTGLTDTGISKNTLTMFLHAFDHLLVPNMGYENVEYWFTEYGLQEFLSTLVDIRNVIRRHGWNIVYKIMEPDDDVRHGILYEDDFQVAVAYDTAKSIDVPAEKFDLRKLKKLCSTTD